MGKRTAQKVLDQRVKLDNEHNHLPLGSEHIKSELFKILENINYHAVGSFATGGALPNAPNPGLYVHCLGVVGLPLSPEIALSYRRSVTKHLLVKAQGLPLTPHLGRPGSSILTSLRREILHGGYGLS